MTAVAYKILPFALWPRTRSVTAIKCRVRHECPHIILPNCGRQRRHCDDQPGQNQSDAALMQGLARQSFCIAQSDEWGSPAGHGHFCCEFQHHRCDNRQHCHREQRADHVEQPLLKQVLGLIEDQRQDGNWHASKQEGRSELEQQQRDGAYLGHGAVHQLRAEGLDFLVEVLVVDRLVHRPTWHASVSAVSCPAATAVYPMPGIGGCFPATEAHSRTSPP
ncbi:hypothetical protein ABZP12_00979 [Xanthomonas euvesicatoria]